MTVIEFRPPSFPPKQAQTKLDMDTELLRTIFHWREARGLMQANWALAERKSLESNYEDSPASTEANEKGHSARHDMECSADLLSRWGAPKTANGASELLGVAMEILNASQIDPDMGTLASGPVMEILLQVKSALDFAGDSPLKAKRRKRKQA